MADIFVEDSRPSPRTATSAASPTRTAMRTFQALAPSLWSAAARRRFSPRSSPSNGCTEAEGQPFVAYLVPSHHEASAALPQIRDVASASWKGRALALP